MCKWRNALREFLNEDKEFYKKIYGSLSKDFDAQGMSDAEIDDFVKTYFTRWDNVKPPYTGFRATTHPMKHTDTGIDIGKRGSPTRTVFRKREEKFSGYVSTASANVGGLIDFEAAANTIPLHKFMAIVCDGKSFLEHIVEGTDAGKEISALSSHGSGLGNFLRKAYFDDESAPVTDRRLRQVYFPVSDGEYVLFTVLTPSVSQRKYTDTLERLGARPDRSNPAEALGWRMKGKREEDLKEEEREELDEIRKREFYFAGGTVQKSVGGTQAQNASVMAKRMMPVYHLLSLPPERKGKSRYPRENLFFSLREILEEHAERIVPLLAAKRNNAPVRKGIRRGYEIAIDSVMARLAEMADTEFDDWEKDSSSIPEYQKKFIETPFSEWGESVSRKEAEELAKDMAGAVWGAIFSVWKRKEKAPVLFGEPELREIEKIALEKIERWIR